MYLYLSPNGKLLSLFILSSGSYQTAAIVYDQLDQTKLIICIPSYLVFCYIQVIFVYTIYCVNMKLNNCFY
ncbi:unnamed protein product [Brugia timori]|uniref:Ovule protein n=1 Tax=Brugia timori TaxID=42155 RepID=A0A0R3QDM9_9BILA|nr:unnamed protein product [Brugia timori]